jgi:hypothetical protein
MTFILNSVLSLCYTRHDEQNKISFAYILKNLILFALYLNMFIFTINDLICIYFKEFLNQLYLFYI